MYTKIIKPFFDRLFAFILLVIASPLMVIIAVLVYFLIDTKFLFTQERIGFKEQPFILYKFRSMKRGMTDFPEQDRIPAFGKFIRGTGLDELPQLWNVLRGEVSFVGPRPLLPEYLVRYSEVQKRRHLVLPGITGLAQIKGRNAVNWASRLELDVLYVQSVSFSTDLKILIATIVRLSKLRDGMPSEPFKGNRDV